MSSTGKTLALGDRVNGYSLEEIEARLEIGKGISGVCKTDLPTPSLLLDLDLFEANVETMARHAASRSIGMRPHSKTHKCPEVARRQMAAGALGISTATVSEAETMAQAGISGLLITSEIADSNKFQRLVRLTRRHPDTMAVVDHPWQAEQMNDAAVAGGVQLNIMLDIDPANRRTGIEAGEPALRLARDVDRLSNLNLRGVHCYCGKSSHVHGFEERRRHSRESMAAPLETFSTMRQEGLPVEIFSGCSTGTYNIDSEIEGITEMQAGSYVFMDLDYRRIGGRGGEVYDDFDPALTVLSTVTSRNLSSQATLDAGLKAFSTDRAFGPRPVGIEGAGFRWGGDEHGILTLEAAGADVRLGDKLEFYPPHCDPTVNLYDRIYCTRGDQVVEVWPILARGHR